MLHRGFHRLSRPPSLPRSGGFTLLEVLLAFVVFSLAFATVLQIMSGTVRNTVRAREYTEAALIAQSVMDQVGLSIPLQEGAGEEGENGEFVWELEIDMYEPGEDDANRVVLADLTGVDLLQVSLVIQRVDAPRSRPYYFSTVKALLRGRGPQT